jgi:ArsR family transcriptional regulator
MAHPGAVSEEREFPGMAEFDDYTVMFKAMADPLRLRLLHLLPAREEKRTSCVCELAEKLGVSQPCLSHHLNILKTAGLVGFEKDGCSAFYFVDKARLGERLGEFRQRMEA